MTSFKQILNRKWFLILMMNHFFLQILKISTLGLMLKTQVVQNAAELIFPLFN